MVFTSDFDKITHNTCRISGIKKPALTHWFNRLKLFSTHAGRKGIISSKMTLA
jgi:hypothetical protein